MSRLLKLTLGNGASTTYTYDGAGRLTAFDHADAQAARLLKHDWTYDALGRKGDITVDIPGFTTTSGFNKIDVEYDAASRLTREELVGAWGPLGYQYDQAGNRTQLTDDLGGIFNFQYGTGNRETLGPNGTLQYDFKGNVTQRPTIDGRDGFVYTWDEYDRLRSSISYENPGTINYDYDALGRLLKRSEDSASEGATVNYWLGLNKIAEEKWSGDAGADGAIFRPDDESTATPEEAGWGVTADAVGTVTMEYTEDAGRGLVMRLTSDDATSDLTARAMLGDAQANNLNANDAAWGDSGRRQLALWVRNANVGGRLGVRAIVQSENGKRTLQFLTQTGTDVLASPNWGNYFLGAQQNDGNWHYLELDLQARFDEFWPGETLQTVDGVKLLGRDLYVDDIVLSGGRLEKSYQLQPAAQIAGYLGAQAGRDAGRSGIEWDQWHYHYNDLGTVLATTDAAGNDIGIYAPDFWGNYRLVLGDRPDTLGLTSKFYDAEAGLYYFNARWYDAERGRFLSRAYYRSDIEASYNLAFQSPANYFDASGNLPAAVAGGILGGIGGAVGGSAVGSLSDLPAEIQSGGQFVCYQACLMASGAIAGAVGGAAGGAAGGALGGIPKVSPRVAKGGGAAVGGAAGAAAGVLLNKIISGCAKKCGSGCPPNKKSAQQCQSDCGHLWGTPAWSSCMKGCRNANPGGAF